MKFNLNGKTNNFNRYKHVESELKVDCCFDFYPDVSVMIPTFKRPILLDEAIASAVGQRVDIKYEIVVVDNDSSGEFEKEILLLMEKYQQYNIRYFRNAQNIGMYGNWNRCVELARADWLTILNDDDVLHCKWLAHTYSAIEHSHFVKVNTKRFVSLTDLDDAGDVDQQCTISYLDIGRLYFGNVNPGSLGILFRLDACIDLGGFNEEFFPSADYEFLIRYAHQFGGRVLNAELAYYRVLDNESLKLSTLESFLIFDFDLRVGDFSHLLARNTLCERFLNQYAKYLAYQYYIYYRDNFNLLLEEKKCLMNLLSVSELVVIKALSFINRRLLNVLVTYSLFKPNDHRVSLGKQIRKLIFFN